MFAQTITYGLFAARLHGPDEEFTRSMQRTTCRERTRFSEAVRRDRGVDMPETLDWAVDVIVDMLSRVDTKVMLENFGRGWGKEDPVVHFDETFLAAYDPKLRAILRRVLHP